jgi:hypothetical protein
MLLVDKERCFLGDTVTVNAVLTDAQRQPLQAAEVEAHIVQPDGTRHPLALKAVQDASREGTFQGQFVPGMEGDFRVELMPPQSVEDLLVQEVRCASSAAETRQPLRNDKVMTAIAERTLGQAYVGLEAALTGSPSQPPLFDAITPQDQETRLPGTPDRDFKRLLSSWLMGLIAGVLCLEWLVRRLSKLA